MPPLPLSVFPDSPRERDRWIAERRTARESVTPDRPYAFLVEQERSATGEVEDIATIFLVNRECPWRCTMCDLWRHTLPHSVALGDIPRQINFALDHLSPARTVKLYNSGSFFDQAAIPLADYPAIANLVQSFDRVIVESHPSLIGERSLHLRDLLAGQLEVAMGLETAHPGVLAKLNKRMTLSQYAEAAGFLAANGIALRTFILVQPPFMHPDESLFWACQSIDFALRCDAAAITLIPTRGGNGATDDLAASGDFVPPSMAVLEDALDYGVGLAANRVFLDLWDIDRVICCPECRRARTERLQAINLSQTVSPRLPCARCGAIT